MCRRCIVNVTLFKDLYEIKSSHYIHCYLWWYPRRQLCFLIGWNFTFFLRNHMCKGIVWKVNIWPSQKFVCFFVNQKSKKATMAGLKFNIGSYDFFFLWLIFSETIDSFEYKLAMNVSWMPLYKMYVYWIIRNPRWMPPHENSLTQDPMSTGKLINNLSQKLQTWQNPNYIWTINVWTLTMFSFSHHQRALFYIGPYENMNKILFLWNYKFC
jgi:hypothetical protein